MSGRLVIMGIIGVLGYALAKGYDYYRRLRYRFAGFSVESIDAEQARLTLNFEIYNPTPVNLTVNNVVGSVYVRGYYIGNVDTTINQTIVSNGVSAVELTVLADIKRVGVVVLGELLKGQFNDLNVIFDGTVTVANIPVKVNINQIINKK